MRLVAKNGPLAGTAVDLTDGLTLGGPDAGLDASRPCCRIRAAAGGGFVLQALDRQAPLFVNGLPLTTRALEVHDELRIGDTLFAVQSADAPSPPALAPCAVHLDSSRQLRPTREVGFDDSVLCRANQRSTREGRDFEALLRLGAALSSVRGLAALDAAFAGLVLEAAPLERVVLTGDADGPAGVRSAWSAAPTAEPITIDPGLVERVVKEHVAAVVNADGRDAIVLPMMAFGRATGALWGETAPGVSLDAGHIRLLLVLAALAAVTREQDREAARLQETNELLQAEINIEHNMVGRSRPMRALFDRIARVARGDATLLLRGESGTGKELVARAVHRNSPRANRPFIAINCAAITESLLESELFGHEKGAFTGAIGLKKGKLELADGGTLFLDEVGELPLALQAKLLRALQEREFDRVGGTRPVRVDFRLVAATNRDLDAAVAAGTFRQDLFYRLNVVVLSLPPLRDRKEDVPTLAEYFLRKHAPRCGRRVAGFTPDALARLAKHDWPGNVRELENVIEQALALGSHDRIVADDLPVGLGCASSASGSLDYHETWEQTRRDLIVRAFERAGHSHAAAARLLGVHPNYLHRLLSQLNLRQRVGGGNGPTPKRH
jgi:Nif-specific regulatory protein